MTTPRDPRTATPVKPAVYKGDELNAERGPGLGCFWIQISALVFLLVLTPLSVVWKWPEWTSAVLLFGIILVLLFAGQTVIFLLRLVAAGRGEGRRRPLASTTPTVGDLEDDETASAGSPDQGMRE
jgi:hypothetical protein